jgi:hypothetical protein
MDDSCTHRSHSCGCTCHKMNGIFVALIGLAFLLGALDVVSQHVVGIAWPVVLILLGLQNSLGRGRCKCCAESKAQPK